MMNDKDFADQAESQLRAGDLGAIVTFARRLARYAETLFIRPCPLLSEEQRATVRHAVELIEGQSVGRPGTYDELEASTALAREIGEVDRELSDMPVESREVSLAIEAVRHALVACGEATWSFVNAWHSLAYHADPEPDFRIAENHDRSEKEHAEQATEAAVQAAATTIRAGYREIVTAALQSSDEGLGDTALAPSTVFVCYAKQDEKTAIEIFCALLDAGFDPWLDHRKLVLGDLWEKEIREAVASCDAFVVCLRPGFDDIGFRQKEVHWALDALHMRPPGHAFIVPFIVEPCELPEWCAPFHAGASPTTRSKIEDLVTAVRKHCWKR